MLPRVYCSTHENPPKCELTVKPVFKIKAYACATSGTTNFVLLLLRPVQRELFNEPAINPSPVNLNIF
ncbi:hypothetical protein L596_009924 [Steinernema carpocapsae]|uniref:Uncharacterized protein n=1 Tax=Steinernema carpocapsae TaxID=34508 RepID=A0A4U5PH93_STECR|nr:hypothetical protein L596_009924 [Steinernema carpocapsae]